MNFNTDRIVIVCYPGNAGGKFLINSLGLSNRSVFQDAKLAQAQLNQTFDKNAKLSFLHNRLNEVQTEWCDLHLGCFQLFGFHNSEYLENSADDIKTKFQFNQVVHQLSEQNTHYFFLVAHSIKIALNFLNVWPNAKLILFVEPDRFISWRYPDRKQDYLNHFYMLQNQINPDVIWDTNWYFDKTMTVNNIKYLYDIMGLDDFDQENIDIYYEHWINKLNQIQQVHRLDK